MKIIKFDEWKDDPQPYQNGVNQFEITIWEWATCDNTTHSNSLKKALNGINKLFYLVNNNNEIVTSENLTTFPNKEDFKAHEKDFTNIKAPVTPVENNENGNGKVDFYTILFLWCLKEKGEKIAKPFSDLDTGTRGRYINIAGNSIHLNVSYGKFFIGAKALFSTYLKDYSDYKVRIIPNNTSNNNGGKENMSDKTENEMEINKYITEKIDAHKQIIFTGAPGTGKTHSVREYVKGKNDEYKEKMKSTDKKHEDIEDIEDIYKFVQFHSSYDYTDFVEGIRPAPKEKNGENMFVRMDGTFKAFCRKIVNANIKDLKKHGIDNIEALYKIMKESKTDTDAIKERRKNIAKAISELPMYYFVIDEINRADLSKVFGELMFGLEEDYRGVQNRFPTQYHNLPTYEMGETETNNDSKMDTQSQKVKKVKKLQIAKEIEDDCFKNGFFVPENLTIIGTMNDIDRSVETFDFALRRRFAWVEIKANAVMRSSVAAINGIEEDEIDDDFDEIINRIKEMNKVISEKEGKNLGLNESYHIGPAYFKNLFDESGDANLETIFNEKIKPILREYTRGRNSDKVETFVDNCNNALLGRNKND